MSQFEQTGNIITGKTEPFLSGKPIWLWRVSYIGLMVFLFDIFYLTFYVLTVRWWIVILLATIVGFVWGTIAFNNKNRSKVKILYERRSNMS
jgi:hypothetical protein